MTCPPFSIRVVPHCLAWLLLVSTVQAEPNWPQWRGPQGTGHSQAEQVPQQWNAESVLWKVPLPGVGQSSPVVWGTRIFLTSALDEGQQRVVYCIDTNTGKTVWEQTAWQGQPEPTHQMNGWASATCATDGTVVVAFFGKGGLHAYDLDGKLLWSLDLGPFVGPWGVAACPILVGDLVIQNCDADENPYLIAVDKLTGKTVWKTERDGPRGWSTPIVIAAAGRTELVLNGHTGVTAYNPQNGEKLWFCKSFNGRGEPTITPAGDLLCAVNGLAGDIYAVRPGGSGDVTETHRAWHTPRRGGRDTPSPIVIGPYMIVADMKGIATCYTAATGAELWKERICDAISSSPIAVNGLAYFQDETGATVIIRPGPTLDVVARNSLGAEKEIFRASLTPLNGRLLSRSQSMLYCIGPAPAAP
ncbi:MAG: PQQ-like beta-propeller repeat protein [Planctomycetes bacterium]|nr:PQQ-like beta-propeller repeat protein [Planctomycetota bacterium]